MEQWGSPSGKKKPLCPIIWTNLWFLLYYIHPHGSWIREYVKGPLFLLTKKQQINKVLWIKGRGVREAMAEFPSSIQKQQVKSGAQFYYFNYFLEFLYIIFIHFFVYSLSNIAGEYLLTNTCTIITMRERNTCTFMISI